MVAVSVNQHCLNTAVSQDLLDIAARWLTLYVCMYCMIALPVT
jgi:hypothetical protein